jgi:hypothetical protein
MYFLITLWKIKKSLRNPYMYGCAHTQLNVTSPYQIEEEYSL